MKICVKNYFVSMRLLSVAVEPFVTGDFTADLSTVSGDGVALLAAAGGISVLSSSSIHEM